MMLQARLLAADEPQETEGSNGQLTCRGVILAILMAWVASRLTSFTEAHVTAPAAVPSFAPPRPSASDPFGFHEQQAGLSATWRVAS